jgi:uncharacterized RDD family membrane protein YckC
VIKTCLHCGAVNGEPSEICCFCDAPLDSARRAPVSRRVSTATEGDLAVEPAWRREVSSRLRAYRVRRHGSAVSDFQTALPFEHDLASPVQNPDPETYSDVHAGSAFQQSAPAVQQRKPRAERFEISINDTPLTRAHDYSRSLAQPHARSSPDFLFPVASLPERRWAALLDVALLLFSYGGMLALFTALGGHLGFNRLDAAVTGATLALFYAQYYALFTIFGGSTPGMMLRGIRVVSFDGSVPTSRQMAWRSFGYLISAGTCFLGFLWARWDEDQLCWQDRISQTYLTPIEGFAMPQASFEDPHPSGMNGQTPASTRGR